MPSMRPGRGGVASPPAPPSAEECRRRAHHEYKCADDAEEPKETAIHLFDLDERRKRRMRTYGMRYSPHSWPSRSRGGPSPRALDGGWRPNATETLSSSMGARPNTCGRSDGATGGGRVQEAPRTDAGVPMARIYRPTSSPVSSKAAWYGTR